MRAQDFIEWRERLGLSQIQAAEELGLSRNTLRAYESGKSRIPIYIKLATITLAEMAEDEDFAKHCWAILYRMPDNPTA